jgi:hypothetical protein
MEEQRKEFCRTKDSSILSKAISIFVENIQFPIAKPNIRKGMFHPSMLDKESIGFKEEFDSIEYVRSSYTNIVDTNHLNSLPEECKRIKNYDWFIRQSKYAQSLSVRQFFIIRAYTFKGDGIINLFRIGETEKAYTMFKRTVKEYANGDNEYFFPYYYQVIDLINTYNQAGIEISSTIKNHELIKFLLKPKESERYIALSEQIKKIDSTRFIRGCIIEFGRELDEIIKHAPKTTQCLTTWRGVKTNYISQSQGIFDHVNFMSISLNMQSAIDFLEDKKCCLKRVILPIGSACLLIGPFSHFGTGEGEILLGLDARLEVNNPNYSFFVPHNNLTVDDTTCFDNNGASKIQGLCLTFRGYS